jgi:uncharacterized protein (TIGR02453 family)
MTQAVATFSDKTLSFLASLATNNNKTWFDAHRSAYEQHLLAPARAFVEDMGEALRELAPDVHAEPRVNGSIFRINRDTRFSNDKRPYKDNLVLWFWQGTRRSRECPGYYLSLRPGALTLGTGMHGFFPELLVAYRDAVGDPLRGSALAAAVQTASESGAEIGGRHYKRVPRGYDAAHSNADLLLHNGLFAGTETSLPAEFGSPPFIDHCLERWRPLAPLQTWLTELVDALPSCARPAGVARSGRCLSLR